MQRSTRVRDVVTGTLAVLTLLTLVIGVPLALVVSVGWPLPTEVPDPATVGNALRYGMIAPATLLKTLAVVVWATWLLMTASVGVEVAALVRGTVARALPNLGGLQQIAARLVATAMMLSTLTARPAVAAPLPPAAVADAGVAAPLSGQDAVSPEEAAATSPAWKVQRHDSLWTIAERALGDGHRWREIHELNVGRRQADGRRLSKGDMMIHPGWVLRLPADAASDQQAGAEPVTVERGDHLWGLAARHLGDGERWREIYERNAGHEQSDGSALARPDVIQPGWVLEIPDRVTGVPAPAGHGDGGHADRSVTDQADGPPGDAPANGRGRGNATGAREEAGDLAKGERTARDVDDESATTPTGAHGAGAPVVRLPVTPETLFGAGWPAAGDHGRSVGQSTVTPDPALASATTTQTERDHLPLAGITLLAAGLVGVLARRRRHWLRQRSPGTALEPVDPEAAELERWLRAIADHDLSHRTERVLRVVAEHFALHEVDPVVLAIEFGERVRLRLETADPAAPPGVSASDDGRTWTLDPELEVAAPMDPDGPALTPTLVTCGHRPSGEVVALNLLAAGVVDVAGGGDAIDEVITSWTAELATNATTDVEVIVVGPHHDLVEQFTTVTVADDPEAVLHRIDRARGASSGVVVLSCAPAEDTAWEAVRGRALEDPRVAVVAPGNDDALHRVHVDGERVVLAPDGIPLERPAWLTPDNWDRFDELVRQPVRQQPSDLVPSPLLSAPFDGHLGQIDDEEPTPERDIRLLGPFEVEGLPASGPDAADLLMFLAVHRGGATVEALAGDLGWDIERTAGVFAATGDALGCDDEGRPLLAVDGDGHHRLSTTVSCDAERLHALTRGLRQTPPAAQAQRLTEALDMVRGVPFRDAGGWAHAESMVPATIALVSDLAHQLATLMMTFGDLERASWAVDQGLLANPSCELLYRDRMRIADARGDFELLDSVMRELRAQAESDHGWVTPETLQLYERLKRSTRITAAAADDHRHAS